jgi:hypothetical protein
MIREDKNMDQLFRTKLDGFEKEPPAFVWENIRQELDAEKQKKRVFWYRVAGVAAALMLAFVAGWQINRFFPGKGEMPQMADQTNTIPAQSEIKEAASPVQFQDNQEEAAIRQTPVLPEKGSRSGHISVAETQISEAVKATDHQVRTTESLAFMSRLERLLDKNPEYTRTLEPVNARVFDRGIDQLTEADRMIANRNQALLASAGKTGGETRRWSLGARVAPGVQVNQSSHSQAYARNMSYSTNKGQPNLSSGISLEYKAHKKWSIQSGVYMAQLEQSSSNVPSSKLYDLAGLDYATNLVTTAVTQKSNSAYMNAVAGVVEFSSLPENSNVVSSITNEYYGTNSTLLMSASDFSQNFEYVEVPLMVSYAVIDSKLGLQLTGGVSTNFLVGNRVYVENESGRDRVGKTQDMQAVNYSGSLGVGISYSLSGHITLNVEPRIKYFLNSLNRNPDVTYKPYTVGFYSGLSYTF